MHGANNHIRTGYTMSASLRRPFQQLVRQFSSSVRTAAASSGGGKVTHKEVSGWPAYFWLLSVQPQKPILEI